MSNVIRTLVLAPILAAMVVGSAVGQVPPLGGRDSG